MKAKKHNANVKSAGIFAEDGHSVSEHTRAVLAEVGLSSEYTSRAVSKELLEWSDLVLCMTESHKQTLALQYPDFQEELFTLKEYVLIDDDQWKQLIDHYTHFEEKRAWVLSHADESLNEVELEQHLLKELDTEIEVIKQAEESLPNLNIIDPYGQSVEVYRETRNELDQTLKLLANKVEKETE